jgi:hypothetical protein
MCLLERKKRFTSYESKSIKSYWLVKCVLQFNSILKILKNSGTPTGLDRNSYRLLLTDWETANASQHGVNAVTDISYKQAALLREFLQLNFFCCWPFSSLNYTTFNIKSFVKVKVYGCVFNSSICKKWFWYNFTAEYDLATNGSHNKHKSRVKQKIWESFCLPSEESWFRCGADCLFKTFCVHPLSWSQLAYYYIIKDLTLRLRFQSLRFNCSDEGSVVVVNFIIVVTLKFYRWL